jgi:DGQHR domain-containing protein
MKKDYKYITYNQPGGTFYACTVNASDLVSSLEIRRRSSNPESGIQRDENAKRIRDIGEYLEGQDGILPTPIIVSAFSGSVEIRDSNNLTIDFSRGAIGHILDGQHRVLGLRSLDPGELEKYDLLVVFVFEIDVYSEATIFVTINSNQKQVSKSLIYDLFALEPKRSKEKVCHEIVKSLNDDGDSPFYGKIKLLGKKMDDAETLSQSAFIDQLLKVLNAKDSVLNKYYERQEDWVIRKVIHNSFSALLRALESDGHNYPKDYFIKTSGYGGVMQALNELIKLGETGGDISEGYFFSIFSDFIGSNPKPPAGTGNAAMLAVKREILDQIEMRKGRAIQ